MKFKILASDIQSEHWQFWGEFRAYHQLRRDSENLNISVLESEDLLAKSSKLPYFTNPKMLWS